MKTLSDWHQQSTVKRVKQVEWQQNARRRTEWQAGQVLQLLRAIIGPTVLVFSTI